MNWRQKIQSRLRALFEKQKLDAEMDEEMRLHVEMRMQSNIEAGMDPKEARYAALRQFGRTESIKETCRDQRGVNWIESVFRDIRFSLRTLGKNPGFAFVAVATLAVGIGTCTAMFSIVNAVLLKPLPFHEPNRLVWIEKSQSNSDRSDRTFRVDTFLGWREQSKSFESLAAYYAFSDYSRFILTGLGNPERLNIAAVSDNFFPTLGVPLLHGRNFTAEECTGHGPGAAIITYGYWQRRFGGDPAIVGKSILLNQKPNTVIGVLPRSVDFAGIFTPGSDVDVILPYPLNADTIRSGSTVFGIGRLRSGITIAQAQEELKVINDRLRETIKQSVEASVQSLDTNLRGRFQPSFRILAGAVVCVLAIACVNLSNLLLARMNARRQEFTVRSVLGASRRSLIQQTLTESLMLAFAGSLIGVPLAILATRLLARLQTFGVPLLQDASVDPMALAVTIGMATFSGIACGLLPAFHLFRRHGGQPQQDATQQRSAGRSAVNARGVLVIAEVALACMLLVGASLLLRSFNAVLQVKLGFQPQNAMAWRIDPSRQFKSGSEAEEYFSGMAEPVAALPGVEMVGFSDSLPLSRSRKWDAAAAGVQYPNNIDPLASPHLVDPHYFKVMQIPLVAGRLFDEKYDPKAGNAVVINENLARQLWPDRSPIGEKMALNGGSTVIGVVANVRHNSLEEDGGNEMYIDYRQCNDWNAMEMVVRSSRSSESLAPEVRAALSAYDPDLPNGRFYKLEQLVDKAVGPRSLITRLLGFFSALALTLAAIGLYGVLAYSVSQRTQEIGIRMAVGARRNDILRLVLDGGIKLVATGILLGLVGSLALTHLLQSLLFGVTAHDPFVFAGNAALLLAVAVAACVMPALRASRIDPMVALRHE